MINIFKLFEEARKYDHPLLISIMILEDEAAKKKREQPR